MTNNISHHRFPMQQSVAEIDICIIIILAGTNLFNELLTVFT